MKIKILKCTDPLFWYNKYINEIFYVQKIENTRVWVRELNEFGCLNFVLNEDFEIYKEIE